MNLLTIRCNLFNYELDKYSILAHDRFKKKASKDLGEALFENNYKWDVTDLYITFTFNLSLGEIDKYIELIENTYYLTYELEETNRW